MAMKKISKCLTLLLMGFASCAPPQAEIKLQSGDLLFRSETTGQLSGAIDKVTQTSADTHFSHVGLVKISGDSVFVLHASSEGGTCQIPLHKFLHPKGDSVKVVAYRLKELWQKTIPEAMKRAGNMLGKPYNFSYILSDSAHYCSEFVYRAFAADSVFKLNPMTFKDPRTGEFYPTWVEYYQKQGIEIPEGKPGCNPNGMAASGKLVRLGTIK
jgi:hypothetical protein